jgi:hypothetical protein
MPSSAYYKKGRYACKVVSQALGENKKGNPQFVLRFLVLGEVDPTEPTNYIPAGQQYERTHYRVITEKTIDYFIDDLKLLGFEGASFKDLDPSSPTFHDMTGLDIDMWCDVEEWDGGTQEKWGVAQVGGFKIEPLDAKKVRDLDNLFGKQLKTLKSDKPKPVAAPAASTSSATAVVDQGITDDDIPF